MGQDISGTSLATTAAANSRRVCYKFTVDWADAGFGSIGSWTDESAYILSLRGQHQASGGDKTIAAVGYGVSDVVYVRCRNPLESGGYSGLRFSSTNSNGSLYSNIQEGRINMKRAAVQMGFYNVSTPEYLYQIVGYIVNISESYDRREITFEIRDRAADAVLTRASTTVQSDNTAKAYLETLCGLLGRDTIAGGDQIFDDGMIIVPWYWLEDEKIWDEMSHVAEAQLGRIWFDKDGDLHFDDGAHFVKPNTNTYDDATTSQATFTVASFADLVPEYKIGSVYNHLLVEYQPRYLGNTQAIFTNSDMIVLYPGETDKPYKAEFQYPAYSFITPVADVDYEAALGGGQDATDSVTISLDTSYAGYADLLLSNSDTDYSVYVTRLQVRGVPLITQEAVKYEAEDATSIGYYGRRTWDIRNNPYIQTWRHAKMAADFLLARCKDPILTVNLRGIPARPWLEVGDRVTVTETLTDLDEDFFITKLSWQFTPGRSAYTQDVELMRTTDLFTYTNYFYLDGSLFGTDPDFGGRLFW